MQRLAALGRHVTAPLQCYRVRDGLEAFGMSGCTGEWHLLRLPALVGAKRSISVLMNTCSDMLLSSRRSWKGDVSSKTDLATGLAKHDLQIWPQPAVSGSKRSGEDVMPLDMELALEDEAMLVRIIA